jgi:hypothetical protein
MVCLLSFYVPSIWNLVFKKKKKNLSLETPSVELKVLES